MTSGSARRLPALPALLACLLLALPTVTTAADKAAGRPLGELYEVARLMDATVLDLNMLLGEEQSPVYKARLDETLKRLDTAQKASSQSLGEIGIAAESGKQITTNVNAFIRLARENGSATMKTGAPENAVVDEMMQHRKAARDTLDKVYQDLETRAALTGSPLSEARALALLLQQMSAVYVENASAAYVSNRSQDSRDKTIDQMAKEFSRGLDGLLGKAKGDEASKLVRGIQSKWKFIERSMLNYQESTVPFLVDRYTQAIVADLMKLAQVLQS